jgi:hypothetical protein
LPPKFEIAGKWFIRGLQNKATLIALCVWEIWQMFINDINNWNQNFVNDHILYHLRQLAFNHKRINLSHYIRFIGEIYFLPWLEQNYKTRYNSRFYWCTFQMLQTKNVFIYFIPCFLHIGVAEDVIGIIHIWKKMYFLGHLKR